MRKCSVIVLSALLVTSYSGGQQITQTVTGLQADTQPAPVKVYAVGPGVSAPELLPLDLGPVPMEKCRRKVNGKFALSLIVDETGKPRNIMFLHPLGTDLDLFALKIVGADRFNPGRYNGASVVIGQSVEVSLQTCVAQTKDDKANKFFRLLLISQPEQNFGELTQPLEEAVLAPDYTSGSAESIDAVTLNLAKNGISPPAPLIWPEAEFSEAARQAKYQGTCLISLIVDRNGLPQDLRVVKALNYGLTEQSIGAVKKYRFKPAMKNGEPVPARIAVEVNFRLY